MPYGVIPYGGIKNNSLIQYQIEGVPGFSDTPFIMLDNLIRNDVLIVNFRYQFALL